VKKIFYLSIILILIFSNYSIAQQKDLWITFNSADGLASNRAQTIIESKDGSLWFGTTGGVSRYRDGIWTTFTTSDGLVYMHVTTIIESKDGSLWFGTPRGVSHYHNGTWTTFTTANGPAYNSVKIMCESSDGALWFGISNGGAGCYKNETWTIFTTIDSLANNNVTTIFESSDSSLWFGTWGGGVSRYRDGIWKSYTTADGLVNNLVSVIIESSDKALWFGTWGGASCYKDGIWKSYTTADGLPDNWILTICESNDGTVWFGTKDGATRYQDSTWKTYTKADGLADNSIFAIFESSDGALWFGTGNGGASRYQPEIWTLFTTADGLGYNSIETIFESSDNAIWFGTYRGGVSRYKNETWTTFTTRDGLADNIVSAILESSDGALWFGTDGGVSHYQNETWTTFTTADGLIDNSVTSICESKSGSIWFGTFKGVSRYQNGIWTNFTTADGLGGKGVGAIIESSDGSLWFGTNGVTRYYNETWTNYTNVDGLADNTVFAICESSDGALWLGNVSGVTRYKDGVWKVFTPLDGLASYYVYTIIESSDKSLWFGTLGGVSRYKDGMWETFTSEDGIGSNTVYSICESKDGNLWFGTYSGASRVRPDKISPFTFIINGPDNKEIIGIFTPTFIFNGKDFQTKQDDLYYSHVVVDTSIIFNESYWSSFSKITAIQTRPLQNGTYKFQVRARDKWGNIDPTPATSTFTIDITHPTVIMNSPVQREHIKSNYIILGSAFDNSPIKDFNYYKLYYGTFISETQEPQWKDDKFTNLKSNEVRNDTLGILNSIGIEDGLYHIRLWAIDTLRHESEDKVLVTIDNTKPIVEISSPKAGDKASKKVDIYATIHDPNLEKYFLEYKMVYQARWQYLHQDTLSLSIENQLIYAWENSSDSGDVYLKLTAWDKAGNSTSDTVLFVLDNRESHLPTANILSPLNNAYVHDFVRIKGYATDKNFTKYTLSLICESIDTLLIESDKKKENEILFTIDTKSFPDDKYKIYLTVLNDRQYQKTDSILITIDNTLPFAQITSLSSDTISCYALIQGEANDVNLKGLTLKYAKVEETDSSKFMLIDTTFTYWNTIKLNGYYTLYLIVEDKGGLRAIDKQTYYIDNPIFDQRNGLRKKHEEFSLYIPPNSYPASVICLEKRSIDDFIFDPEDITPTDLICEIHSSIEETQFNKSAVFTIDYNNNDLSQFDESKLRVFSWEDDNWNLLGGTLDEDKRIITTAINRIGIYGLFECQKEIETSDKGLQVDCQPRMISPRGGGYSTETNISFYLGKDSNVTINIFNMAGRLVNTLCENKFVTNGMNSIAWNGKDSSDRFCISGLYVVLIQAEEDNATKTVMVLNK